MTPAHGWLALALALVATPPAPVEDAQAVASVIESGGGEVVRENGRVVGVQLPRTGVRELVPRLRAFPHLRTLVAENTEIHNRDLGHLQELRHLQELDLSGTRVNDEGLAHLCAGPVLWPGGLSLAPAEGGAQMLPPLPALETLNLSDTCVRHDGLAYLRRLRNLHTLDLRNTLVDAAGIAHLRHCRSLRRLRLNHAQVNDAVLECLAREGQLHVLELARGDGREPASSPAEVRQLTLFDCPVTDQGLKHLRDLVRLEQLDIRSTPIKGPGLAHLKPLRNLRTLVLSSAQVTDEALEALHRADLLHALWWADSQSTGRPALALEVESLNLAGTPVSARGLAHLKRLENLRTLNLAPHQLTDEALANLSAAGLLHALDRARSASGGRPASGMGVASLNLCGTPVTGRGLIHLKRLENLRALALDPRQVTDEALASLSAADLLHALGNAWAEDGKRAIEADEVARLYLQTTAVTSEGLRHLRHLGELRILDLSDTRVNDEGLRHLRHLANLRVVSLEQTEVRGAGLRHLQGLKNLQFISLGDAQVNDESLAALAGSGQLHLLGRATAREGFRPSSDARIRRLDLSKAALTDAGLAHLQGLARLEELNLERTTVSGRGLATLRPLGCLHTLSLEVGRLTDEVLAGLAQVGLLHALGQARAPDGRRPSCSAAVIHLDLRRSRVTDDGLKHLRRLANLQSLDLRQSPLRGPGLAHLQSLRLLRTVRLEQDQLTDDVLATLSAAGRLPLLEQASTHEGQRPATDTDIHRLALADSPVSDRGLRHLRTLTGLRHLELRETAVRGPGLEHLRPLRQLRTIAIASAQVSDATLAALARADLLHTLPEARTADDKRPPSAGAVASLELSQSGVTDGGLRHLRALANLQYLGLRNTSVKGPGLVHLKSFRALRTVALADEQLTDDVLATLSAARLLHLLAQAGTDDEQRPASDAEVRRLNLAGTAVTDRGMRHLRTLTGLRSLSLRETAVGDDGLKELARGGVLWPAAPSLVPEGNLAPRAAPSLPALERLDLGRTRVGVAGLRHLAHLASLRSLELDDTALGDADLPHLRQLTRLRRLNLYHTEVSASAAERLGRERPGLEVFR